ncbi:amino acid permease [Granulicella arctica]|uniref:APA family basic amino acid/polyamine antiporter n=1 Tax=Granulicella arctica TaxID=940613 RepID=A0A7Y9PIE0_9BACT|nr:amino acid permease [Granulicella arctica]NYF80309.1 APA family basic amino acid/polyamine antiporter [Granulicella arctica]
MGNLFAKKSLNDMTAEANEKGAGTLERVLGPVQLTMLGIGAVIGAGIFVLSGLGAKTAGPALMLSFVLSGLGCAFAGLCYAEFAAMIPLAGSAYTYAYATLGELIAWIIGWDLTLEYAMGASTVSSGWSNNFVEVLNIFHLKFPLWLAYDHWTGLRQATDTVARKMVLAAHPGMVPGTGAFSDAMDALKAAHPAALTTQAHALLNAPHLFGMEIGINVPAFLIALVITVILVIGIQESAKFNGAIVTTKIAIVLFVLGFGSHYVTKGNWGTDWHTFAPFGVGGIGLAAGLVFFSYIGFDAVSTTAQEAKNPQRDLPIGIIVSLTICTLLYIGVAAVLTGMVPWREVNIEAPISRAFLDHNLAWASNIITIGALAGLTSVMLVMLLGQSRVLYAMAHDGLLPRKFFGDIHPRFRTPWKGTILAGALAAVVGSITPIDDIGKMVNIGTLLAFVIVCIAIIVLRKTDPDRARPFKTPFVPLVPILGIFFNGYMMYKLGVWNWVRLVVWLIIGLVVYFTYSRKHSKLQQSLEAEGK